MKTLILLRHGKSSWDDDDQEDHARPLAKRGKKAAALMGRYLADLGEVPDRACASSAVRASDTVRRAAEAGAWSCPVAISDRLYHAVPDQVLDIIRGAETTTDSLLLVGHEPTCSMLAGRLVGQARLTFPTAAMARIDLAVERWRDVAYGKGSLVWMVTPKLLARIGWPDGSR
jgi:phosphohistidine phosphatase